MHKLTFHITNKAPIVIPDHHGDMNMVGTKTYLPGTTILGIIVNVYLKNKKIHPQEARKDEKFFNWFLKGGLSFRNAYIHLKDSNYQERTYLPAPFSIQQMKNEDVIYDLLFKDEDDDIFHQSTMPIDLYCSLEDGIAYTKAVDTTVQAHHQRDRNKGIPKSGILFNYEAIVPGQVFESEIIGEEKELIALMGILGNTFEARIGRSKNAEYGGELEIRFSHSAPVPVENNSDLYADEVSLTLISDTIVYNNLGYPSLQRKDLEQYLSGAKIINAFLRKTDTEQYMGIWQMKTPSEVCLLAGSNFLLDISHLNPHAKALVFSLEEAGLGERTNEGFGQCLINRQIYRAEYAKVSVHPPEARVPEGVTPPYQAISVLKQVIKNLINQEIRTLAFQDQILFKNLPTNALLSRLQAMAHLPNETLDKLVGQLKDTAQNQLRSCKNARTKLLDFLMEEKKMAERVLRHAYFKDLKKLCEEIGYKPENDSVLESSLHKVYYQTFFTMMRK